MTAAELHNLEHVYRGTHALAEAAREARNAAVRDALDEGWTQAEIAEATGLTRGRIHQIGSPS